MIYVTQIIWCSRRYYFAANLALVIAFDSCQDESPLIFMYLVEKKSFLVERLFFTPTFNVFYTSFYFLFATHSSPTYFSSLVTYIYKSLQALSSLDLLKQPESSISLFLIDSSYSTLETSFWSCSSSSSIYDFVASDYAVKLSIAFCLSATIDF